MTIAVYVPQPGRAIDANFDDASYVPPAGNAIVVDFQNQVSEALSAGWFFFFFE